LHAFLHAKNVDKYGASALSIVLLALMALAYMILNLFVITEADLALAPSEGRSHELIVSDVEFFVFLYYF
jgi:hypothetical protein